MGNDAKGMPGKTSNTQDGIYRNGGGQLLLDVVETADGYAATFDIGLLTAATAGAAVAVQPSSASKRA